MESSQSSEEMESLETRLENLQIQNVDYRIDGLGLTNWNTWNPSQKEATIPFFVSNVARQTDILQSPIFMVRSMQWRMMVIPNEAGLGFFVQCNGRSDFPNWSCNASIELRLVSNKPGVEHYVKGPINHLFNAEEDDYGFSIFIRWPELLYMADAYILLKGVLLEVQVIADAPQGLEN